MMWSNSTATNFQQPSPHSIAFFGLDLGSGSSLVIKMSFCRKDSNKAKVYFHWKDGVSLEGVSIKGLFQ